jgi:hypothetical protein
MLPAVARELSVSINYAYRIRNAHVRVEVSV